VIHFLMDDGEDICGFHLKKTAVGIVKLPTCSLSSRWPLSFFVHNSFACKPRVHAACHTDHIKQNYHLVSL
jgi:hypothetical protein